MMLKNLIRFGGKSSPSYREPRTRGATTLFQWKILLGAFLLMTVFVSLSGFLIYREINSNEFFFGAETKVSNPEILKLSRLEAIVGYFENKKVTFEQVRKNRTVLVDPSR